MENRLDDLEQLRAFTFGMQAAFVATIGALIRTHPDPKALDRLLQVYRQRELAYLENSTLPEHVLDSFHQMWRRVDIEIQQAQLDGPPQPQAPG